MEDLANEFSSYAMIEDIGSSAPCGLQRPSSKKQISIIDTLDDQTSKKLSPTSHFNSTYKSKLSYSVNLNSIMPNQISPSKNTSRTSHRYSTRSSSILLKSNSLALSDSESTLSDDTRGTSFFNGRKQPRAKKSKRKKSDKNAQLYSAIQISDNSDQYYGKRKRSTTITQNTYEPICTGVQMSSYTTNKLKKNEFNNLTMQCDFEENNKLSGPPQQNEHKMELDDEQEDSSTTQSDESNLSDPRFFCDADDEQSDYYELSNFQKKNSSRRQYGRTELDNRTSNPFSTLSSTSPSTSSLWKRRRRNLPNNHFN